MKKRMLFSLILISISVLLSGCSRKKTTDYIKKYNSQLNQMLGDYIVMEEKVEHNEGFYDFNGYDYKV